MPEPRVELVWTDDSRHPTQCWPKLMDHGCLRAENALWLLGLVKLLTQRGNLLSHALCEGHVMTFFVLFH